jgi:hypothetical protein
MSTNSRKPSQGRRPDPKASVRPGELLKNRKLLAIAAVCVIVLAIIIGVAVSKSHKKADVGARIISPPSRFRTTAPSPWLSTALRTRDR